MGHVVTPLSELCDSVGFSQVIRRHADVMTLLQGAEKARRVLFASSVIIQFPFQKSTVRGGWVFAEGSNWLSVGEPLGGAAIYMGKMFFVFFLWKKH